uniref:Uncharacterized protein n=1 Tax=Romanomermis culicivorax TaxID=13658 RepID=A0A915JXK0_ROMCU
MTAKNIYLNTAFNQVEPQGQGFPHENVRSCNLKNAKIKYSRQKCLHRAFTIEFFAQKDWSIKWVDFDPKLDYYYWTVFVD